MHTAHCIPALLREAFAHSAWWRLDRRGSRTARGDLAAARLWERARNVGVARRVAIDVAEVGRQRALEGIVRRLQKREVAQRAEAREAAGELGSRCLGIEPDVAQQRQLRKIWQGAFELVASHEEDLQGREPLEGGRVDGAASP